MFSTPIAVCMQITTSQETAMARTIIGLADTREQAQQIVDDLLENGFDQHQIGFVAKDEKGEYAAERIPIGAAEKGAVIGAAIGGGGTFLAGIAGIVAAPAAAPIIAAGTILATIAAAGVGGLGGAIVGALVKNGVPEKDARHFAEGVRAGGILVVVHPGAERLQEAKMIMDRTGAVTEWNEDGTPLRRPVAQGAKAPEERLNR
jgi:hypothetical protein